jgi:hypothetical protein
MSASSAARPAGHVIDFSATGSSLPYADGVAEDHALPAGSPAQGDDQDGCADHDRATHSATARHDDDQQASAQRVRDR